MYIYIYRTTMATSCDVDAPRCTTEVLRVRFHWSRGGFFVGHRPPPGTPVTPRDMERELKKEMLQNIAEVLHLFRCCTHTHTTHNSVTLTICLAPSPFIFPAFPIPCLHLFCAYWKKLTSRVSRPFGSQNNFAKKIPYPEPT